MNREQFLATLKSEGYAEYGWYKVEYLGDNVYHMDEDISSCPAGTLRDPLNPMSRNNPASIYLIKEDDELLIIDGGNIPPAGSYAEECAKVILEEMAEDRAAVFALTHSHGDHVGLLMNHRITENMQVRNIYLAEEDYADNPKAFIYGISACEPWKDKTVCLKDGDTFTVGETVYEMCGIKAHTPGSCVFLRKNHNMVFTGDSLGCGYIWIFWQKEKNPIRILEEGIIRLQGKIEQEESVRLFGGHRWQQFAVSNMQKPEEMYGFYLREMRLVIEGLKDGTTRTVFYPERPNAIEAFRDGCRAKIDTEEGFLEVYRGNV